MWVFCLKISHYRLLIQERYPMSLLYARGKPGTRRTWLYRPGSQEGPSLLSSKLACPCPDSWLDFSLATAVSFSILWSGGGIRRVCVPHLLIRQSPQQRWPGAAPAAWGSPPRPLLSRGSSGKSVEHTASMLPQAGTSWAPLVLSVLGVALGAPWCTGPRCHFSTREVAQVGWGLDINPALGPPGLIIHSWVRLEGEFEPWYPVH